ncbi:MAG: hypothetical protein AABZ09_01885 [Candidatus Binatota bacterium]|mgnify:CR=1 FL=1
MELQKINVKFFVADASKIPLENFIHIFNSWIQASNGEYYDLADYSHVRAGPGILLIAHEANISMDNSGDRLGLLYNRKQVLSGGSQEKLQFVFKVALEFCRRIEDEPSLKERLKFRGNEALFLINDRRMAPNSEETFREVRPELEKLAGRLYGRSEFTLEHNPDPRERFSVHIRTPRVFEVGALLENLGSQGGQAVGVSG